LTGGDSAPGVPFTVLGSMIGLRLHADDTSGDNNFA